MVIWYLPTYKMEKYIIWYLLILQRQVPTKNLYRTYIAKVGIKYGTYIPIAKPGTYQQLNFLPTSVHVMKES